MPTSQINGVGIYWEIEGQSGEPLVLVHGSWGDHTNWAPVVPALSRSFRVLTYDRRGHSRSERPAGQGSVREDAMDLAEVLAQLGPGPVHVVGSSFGAAIALRLAAQRSELFASLIVHEPPLFDLLEDEPEAQASLSAARDRMSRVVSLLEAGEWSSGARQFVETIAFGPGSWTELPDEVRQTFVTNAPTWLDEMHDPDALSLDLEGLRSFSAPALLTVGDQSAPFFAPTLDRIAAAMPRAERWTYAGAGHVPYLTHPSEYVRVVEDFIGRAAAA